MEAFKVFGLATNHEVYDSEYGWMYEAVASANSRQP
jgi:hypothetical protein